MTMLEKLARAVCRCVYASPGMGLHVHGPEVVEGYVDINWRNHIDQARAVLTALREPDEGMIRAAYVAAVEEFYTLPDETALDSVRRRLGVVSWQAQIDAILNEKAASL